MVKIKLFLLVMLISVFFPLFAQKPGDKVYKEITLQGKAQEKWLSLFSVFEYDKTCRLISDHFMISLC